MALLEPHPLAELFPLMSDDEYKALVADIKEHGLFDPVVVYEGKILDGRNRYRACWESDISVQLVDYEGDDPLAFVVSHNLKRRHLNESQRAMVAAKIANMRQGERTDLRPMGQKSTSRQEAADYLNVSTKSVQRAHAIREHGIPELQQAVERGEIAVRPASRIATLEPEQQAEVLVTNTVKEKAREIEQRTPQGRGYLASDKPFEINGSQKKQWNANKAYERFATAMGGIAGYRDGLESFDLRPVLAVARPDEIEEWARTITEFISVARKVHAVLREGK